MPRVLPPLAFLLLASWALTACGQVLAAVIAPEAVAANTAAEALGGSLNAVSAAQVASEARTLSDLDRILSTLPEDSPQRRDLTDLRERLAERAPTWEDRGAQHRFASDPQRGLDLDRRRVPDEAAPEKLLPTRRNEIMQQSDRGHILCLDPPRRVGIDAPQPRDEPKPFHVARSSDLDLWEPRFYGTSMPRFPTLPAQRTAPDR